MRPLCFLIDDDKDDQEFFELAVSQLAYPVNYRIFSDITEAIEILNKQQEKPDYIFLGHNMPFMKGADWLRKPKMLPAAVSIPVIVHSDIQDADIMNEFKKQGAKEYTLKTPCIEKFKTYLNSLFPLMSGASA